MSSFSMKLLTFRILNRLKGIYKAFTYDNSGIFNDLKEIHGTLRESKGS